MRTLLVAICVLGMPCVSSAQASKTSWENLNSLRAGQKIQVVRMDSKRDSGKFLNISDAAISLQEKSGEQTIQKQDVRSVKLMEHKHRLVNTLLGVTIGAGGGIAIGSAIGGRDTLSSDAYGVLGGAIGFVGGVIVGVLWPYHPTLYRAPTH